MTIPERNKTEERGGRKGSEKGEREEVGRRGEKRVYIPNSTYNFVSLVSSSTMADASSSRNCMHMARRLSA